MEAVQRKFRDIETWYTQAKITDQDNAEYEQKKADLQEALADAQAEPPDAIGRRGLHGPKPRPRADAERLRSGERGERR